MSLIKINLSFHLNALSKHSSSNVNPLRENSIGYKVTWQSQSIFNNRVLLNRSNASTYKNINLFMFILFSIYLNKYIARMHSSRMRTNPSSSHLRGVWLPTRPDTLQTRHHHPQTRHPQTRRPPPDQTPDTHPPRTDRCLWKHYLTRFATLCGIYLCPVTLSDGLCPSVSLIPFRRRLHWWCRTLIIWRRWNASVREWWTAESEWREQNRSLRSLHRSPSKHGFWNVWTRSHAKVVKILSKILLVIDLGFELVFLDYHRHRFHSFWTVVNLKSQVMRSKSQNKYFYFSFFSEILAGLTPRKISGLSRHRWDSPMTLNGITIYP